MADEMPNVETREASVLTRAFFPYDSPRFRHLSTNLALCVFFSVQRWHWNEKGIYSFLADKDRAIVATTCYSARQEHLERLSDDEYVASPDHFSRTTNLVQA